MLQALNADNETGQFQWKNDIGIMSNLKNVKKKYRWKCIVKKELLPCRDNNLSKQERVGGVGGVDTDRIMERYGELGIVTT